MSFLKRLAHSSDFQYIAEASYMPSLLRRWNAIFESDFITENWLAKMAAKDRFTRHLLMKMIGWVCSLTLVVYGAALLSVGGYYKTLITLTHLFVGITAVRWAIYLYASLYDGYPYVVPALILYNMMQHIGWEAKEFFAAHREELTSESMTAAATAEQPGDDSTPASQSTEGSRTLSRQSSTATTVSLSSNGAEESADEAEEPPSDKDSADEAEDENECAEVAPCLAQVRSRYRARTGEDTTN